MKNLDRILSFIGQSRESRPVLSHRTLCSDKNRYILTFLLSTKHLLAPWNLEYLICDCCN